MAKPRRRSTKRRKNAQSGVSKLRDVLYKTNKLLGDVNAVQKGKVGGRIERRILGKVAAKGLGSELLKFFR